MKLSFKKIVLICLVIASPVPLTIGPGTTGLYPYEIFILIGLIIFLIINPFLHGKLIIPGRDIGWLEKGMILFFIWVVIGLFVNLAFYTIDYSFIKSIGHDYQYLQFKLVLHVLITIIIIASAFFIGEQMFDCEKDFYKVCWAILGGAIITAMSTLITWMKETGGEISRYNFEIPTGLGAGDTSRVALIGVLFGMVVLFNARSRFERICVIIILLILVTCILIIQSRQSYFVALISILTASVWLSHINKSSKAKRISIVFTVLFMSSMFVLLFATNFYIDVLALINTTESMDVFNRMAVINNAFDLFCENPIAGIGWGQFIIYSKVPMIVSLQEVYVASPHNGLFQLLSETGIVGTSLAIMISFLLIKKLLYSYKAVDSTLHQSFIGVAIILILYIVVAQFITSSGLFPPPNQRSAVRSSFYAWFIAGYAIKLGFSNKSSATRN